jgi:hypothetical protein
MKKLLKGIVGIASVAAAAAGVYYVAKKWMGEQDIFDEDDFDGDDFEEEFDEEAEDAREYVTLDLEEDEEGES